MERRIAIGRAGGFTVIELLVVLLIVSLLVSLAVPAVTRSIKRAEEAALRENLYLMRRAIDDYYTDRGVYPPSLEELVVAKYLRAIPSDPVTGSDASWVPHSVVDGLGNEGVIDVFSGAREKSLDGSEYRQW